MSQERNLKDNILLVIKGIAMGTANKVPGVSGGIVAFVAGFYEEFVYSLQKFNRKALGLLFQRGFKSFFQYINARFLGLLVLGMVISYFSVSKLLDYLLSTSEIRVWAVFFGMIIGSIYYVLRDFRDWNIHSIMGCLTGLLVGISITFLHPAEENTNLIFIFFCGIIGVSGMTLPGLSGSFILILAGNYILLMVDSVNVLYDSISFALSGNFDFLQDEEHMRMLTILFVFTAGSVVGMIVFSQLLSYLLKKYHNLTISVIIGFITGSLGVVWPWRYTNYRIDNTGNPLLDDKGRKLVADYQRYLPNFYDETTWVTLFFVMLGILIILCLEWYGRKQKR